MDSNSICSFSLLTHTSNQENRVRKQVKNLCEAHKIKVSQIFYKKLALIS